MDSFFQSHCRLEPKASLGLYCSIHCLCSTFIGFNHSFVIITNKIIKFLSTQDLRDKTSNQVGFI